MDETARLSVISVAVGFIYKAFTNNNKNSNSNKRNHIVVSHMNYTRCTIGKKVPEL